MMNEKEKRSLIEMAIEARLKSYSPYSKFSVGAAILTGSGRIYTGANVENASYGLSICAERSAAVKAVNDSERKFVAVACVGGSNDQLFYCSPCGACRQFLFEFNSETGTEIIGLDQNDKIISDLLPNLLPKAFGPNNLNI